MSRDNTVKYSELEREFEGPLMECHETRDQVGEYFLHKLGNHQSKNKQIELLEGRRRTIAEVEDSLITLRRL